MPTLRVIARALILLLLLPAGGPQAQPESFVRYSAPEFLTFPELVSLSKDPTPEGALKKKVEAVFHTPIISNEAWFAGVRPRHLHDVRLGQFMRVASWNIEKSLHVPEAIQVFTSRIDFEKMIDLEKAAPGSKELKVALRQRDRLAEADILILQEMEIGVKRSGYLNAAAEMAEALQMNYAYGTQYLEVDPVNLGLETLLYEEGQPDLEAMEYYREDPERYKGLFGSAVLSRYPIKSVELKPLKTQPYDWYWGEKENLSYLEHARRFGTKALFLNEITREMKVGGRHYFRVDLEVPELPGGTLTIINVHLEIKCQPKDRKAQLEEIFGYIRDIRNPVILMGDFNAAPTDISPTTLFRTVKRTTKNPTTWFSLAVNAVSPHALAINSSRLVSNVTKNFDDPFARNIKVVAPNPLKPMFSMIRYFHFNDGTAFDFRGNPNRSVGRKDELLANSNQRDFKGFKTTFSVRRPLGIVGKYRLDWALVKSSFLTDPEDPYGSYRFAPHFGETLEEMNTSLRQPVSDHHPNVIDLPFEEPNF